MTAVGIRVSRSRQTFARRSAIYLRQRRETRTSEGISLGDEVTGGL